MRLRTRIIIDGNAGKNMNNYINILWQSGIILLLFSFLLPLLLVHGKCSWIRKSALFSMIAGSVALTYVAGLVLYRGEVVSLVFFSLPFVMFIDRLAAFFVLVVAIISASVAIYSLSYVEHYAATTKKNLLVALMKTIKDKNKGR